MMSENITQDDCKCSNPECESSGFLELRMVAQLAVNIGQGKHSFNIELPREEQDIWGFVCVACETVADARLKRNILSFVYKI